MRQHYYFNVDEGVRFAITGHLNVDRFHLYIYFFTNLEIGLLLWLYTQTHSCFLCKWGLTWAEKLQIGPFNKPDKCPPTWLLAWEECSVYHTAADGNHKLDWLHKRGFMQVFLFTSLYNESILRKWPRCVLTQTVTYCVFPEGVIHHIIQSESRWNEKKATCLNDISLYRTIAISGTITWGQFPPFCTTTQHTCEWVLSDEYTRRECILIKVQTKSI